MPEKKKIVITVDWFDPAYRAGGPVTSIKNMVENLHDLFDFRIITGCMDYGQTEPMAVATDCWTDWKGMAKVHYVSKAKQSREHLHELLDEEEADIYYIQGIFSRVFSIYPLVWWHKAKEERVIVAPRGMLHESALGVKPWKKKVYLQAAKWMGWFHHVLFHSTNPEETLHIQKVFSKDAECREAENFAKVTAYLKEKSVKKEQSLKLLCVSRISPEKNVNFIPEVLSEIDYPVEITFVGSALDEVYFKEFMDKVNALPTHIKATYAGEKTPDELQNYYQNHDVFILPTLGENFGHAIAEALQSGLPCIIGDNTPWKNLGSAGAGYDIPPVKDDYKNAIAYFWECTPDEYSQRSQAARKYFDDKVDIHSLINKYIQLFQ
ncbi:MAG: glycosyltransferase family 4 protein [Bacteroidetes bacterium]|nr:glycosyltransferase family 4 protein [Bacteroidota bacterium]